MKRRAHVLLTFTKELRETLRDRRTVAVMVLFPLFVYPLLSLLVTQVLATRTRQQEARASRVVIEGPEAAVAAVARRLAERPAAFSVAPTGAPAQIEAGTLDAIVKIEGAAQTAPPPPWKAELVFDGTLDRSRQAEDRLEDRLFCALPEGQAPLFSLKKRDIAPKTKVGGYLLSKALPLILVLMVLLGAFYPAIDVTAGERERGTLETSLSAPIKRRDLLLGKLLAVVVLASLTGLLNLVSMSVTLRQLMQIAEPGAAVPVPWLRAAATSLVVLPCAFLFGAVFITIGSLARGFKEAQNLLMPAYFLLFTPAMVGAIAELPLVGVAALVPGMNVTLLARDLALGEASALGAALAVGSTLAYGLIAVALAARLYASEGFLDAKARGRGAGRSVAATAPGEETTSAGEALGLFAVAYLLLYFVFIPMQQRSLMPGLLASQWLGMFGLVLAFARRKRSRFVDVVRLQPPPAAALLGGALVGLSAFLVAALLTEWILPPPKALIEQLRKTIVASDGSRGLGATLLIIAVTPAICEEVLFRGPLLRGLQRRLPAVALVVTNGLMFGLLHIDLWRLLPTGLLGIALATLAVRSGSLWPSVIAHLCNNGTLIVLARLRLDETWLERMPALGQAALLAVAAGATTAGLWLAGRAAKASSVG